MSGGAHTDGLVVRANCGGGMNIGVMHPVKGGEVFVAVGRSLAVNNPLDLRGREPVGEAEALANAALWKAAPDLLEALELILPLAKGYRPEGQTDTARRTCNSWVEAAEAAIQKARPTPLDPDGGDR